MALRKKVLIFNKRLRVQHQGGYWLGTHRHRWAGSQITYLEVGNDLFTNWK